MKLVKEQSYFAHERKTNISPSDGAADYIGGSGYSGYVFDSSHTQPVVGLVPVACVGLPIAHDRYAA